MGHGGNIEAHPQRHNFTLFWCYQYHIIVKSDDTCRLYFHRREMFRTSLNIMQKLANGIGFRSGAPRFTSLCMCMYVCVREKSECQIKSSPFVVSEEYQDSGVMRVVLLAGHEHLGDNAEATLPTARREAVASPPDQRHQPRHGAPGVPARSGGTAQRARSPQHTGLGTDAGAAATPQGYDRGEACIGAFGECVFAQLVRSWLALKTRSRTNPYIRWVRVMVK